MTIYINDLNDCICKAYVTSAKCFEYFLPRSFFSLSLDYRFILSKYSTSYKVFLDFMRLYFLQLEEVQGHCDPNPSEYVDVDVAEPHVIFCWGLQPGKTKVIDIEFVKDDFWSNISNGYQGSPGRMALSIIQASQLPKYTHFDSLSKKVTKARSKMIDFYQQRIPMYSQHLPNYVVGYVSTNGDPEYPSAGG